MCGLLAGCDTPPAEAPLPRTAPPARVEVPSPPFGGAASPDGLTLRCPSTRLALTRPWWFVFSDTGDADCPVGASESRLLTPTGPPDALGACTVSWRGTLRDGAPHRFAGVGTALAWADLTPYSAITLMTRGDGASYRLELIDSDHDTSDEGCEDPDWDFHGSAFRCGTGGAAWSAVTIPFDTLRQSGWGTARALDLSAVDRLHVRTQSEADGDFACDFWIQSVTSARGDVLPLQ